MKRKGILFMLGLAGLIVLAACSSAGSGVATQEGVSVQPVPTEAVQRDEETPTLPPTVEEAVEPTAAAEPTATEQAEVVAVREGLAASNPSDFQVASGEVQLVEFFAYW